MIKDNVIYFGYGDIAVYTCGDYLTLQWFKPPLEIGSSLKGKEVTWLSEQIKLWVTRKNLNDLDKIDGKVNKQLIMGDYILDFSNYNKTSIEMVRKYMKIAVNNAMFILAC